MKKIKLEKDIKLEVGVTYFTELGEITIESKTKDSGLNFTYNEKEYKNRERRVVYKLLGVENLLPEPKVRVVSKIMTDDEIYKLAEQKMQIVSMKVNWLRQYTYDQLGDEFITEEYIDEMVNNFMNKMVATLTEKRDNLAKKSAERIIAKSEKVANEVKGSIIQNAMQNAINNLIEKGIAKDESEAKIILGI